jgi:hypothetical protein
VIIVSILSLFLIAACVFVPIFGIALYMLKSARRAFGIASVFSLGSTFGFVIGWALAGVLVANAIGPASHEGRDVLGVAIATVCAIVGGVLAVWLLTRKTGLRS